jgi:hypothetical protein
VESIFNGGVMFKNDFNILKHLKKPKSQKPSPVKKSFTTRYRQFYIVKNVIQYSFISAVFSMGFAVFGDVPITIIESIWKIFIPLIALSIGFMFGGSKK